MWVKLNGSLAIRNKTTGAIASKNAVAKVTALSFYVAVY